MVVVGEGAAAEQVADEVVRQGGSVVLLRREMENRALRPTDGIEAVSSRLLGMRGVPGRMTAVTDNGEVGCSAVIIVNDLEVSPPENGGTPLRALSDGRVPGGTVVLDLRGGPDRGGRARALKAMEKMLGDGSRVIVLVDEMLAYGRDELLYYRAHQAGALFIRPRAVDWDGQRMDVIDDMTGASISIVPDAFISESTVRECLADRGAVSMGPMTEGTRPAEVDEDRCSACLTCVRICPFGAARMNAEGKASINGDACRSCGKCAAACAGKAIVLPGSTDLDLEARIAAAMEGR